MDISRLNQVEHEILSVIEVVNTTLKIGAVIRPESCPGNIGISSQILVTLMGRLESALNIIIPNNTYIFHDKDTNKQLSIKEAALKLINVAKDEKK